ncbi:8844_t:CDS:10, partial [Racocetra fulgida]
MAGSELSPELYASRLLDPNSVEVYQNADYNRFLQALMPVLTKMLTEEQPVFDSNSEEQKENEDNAVICLKIIIDLHRSYKHQLVDLVKPFLDIVQEMYKNMEQTVKDSFDSPGIAATPNVGTVSTPVQPIVLVPPSSRPSSPVSDVTTNETTPNKVLAGTEAQEAARARGEIFVGVAPGIRDRAKYTEFIIAQTMSFLAYVLRAYTHALQEYQSMIPDFVIRLLQDCPPEASATRKELLVATRHILSTDFRSAFVSKIDILLNEKVLIGSGVTSHDTLRPLAYSMLADLVHHVRNELSPVQLSRTVYIYSRNLHDPTLAASIQTMCSKLLLNLTECIVKIPKNDGKEEDLLIKILDTFANKFVTLNLVFADIQRQQRKKKAAASDSSITEKIDDFDFEQARPINTSTPNGRFLFRNLVTGLKPIIQWLKECNPPLPSNSKAPIQQPNSVARGFTQEQVDIFIRLFREGVRCFDYFNIDNVDTNQVKYSDKLTPMEIPSRIGPYSKVEKEALEHFSSAFVMVDPAIFQEIFASQMNFFFDQMLQNTSLLQIPQYFLAHNDVISQSFAGILLRFLVDRLDKLGGPDPLYSQVMLRLFKLAFMAVTLFPNHNESVLHPHLANIITSSMKLSAKAKEPINYFLLLRALFRSIGGGRFETLYKEVFPLLQVLLEGLNSLLSLIHKQRMRDLFVELCLTVPVRLSVLLPFLSYLMKPLVLALQAGPELVTQGLRTLELCIDNLTPEFLDPIMAPVINDLMNALWKHLKPTPYNNTHSHVAMRILGKLGGRNRRMLKDPAQLNYYAPPLNGIDLQIYFEPHVNPHNLSLDEGLALAARVLQDPNITLFYKKNAYKFLIATIPLFINLDEGPENLAILITARVQQQLLQNNDGEDMEIIQSSTENTQGDIPIVTDEFRELSINNMASKEGHKQILKRKVVQEETLQSVIYSLFVASSLPDLKDQAWPFLENICRHFALLEVSEALNYRYTREKRFDFNDDEKQYNLETKVMVEALVEVITSENTNLSKLAETALTLIYETCVIITGSKDALIRFPLFHVLASRFCSCCYKQEWFRKDGGCAGISILSSKLDMGTQWMLEHELEFVRSLLFILKDMSPEFAAGYVENASQTLLHVLTVCNQQEQSESHSEDIEMTDSKDERQTKFDKLINLLTSELSNANSAVRETVQASFKIIAELKKCNVTDLLSGARDTLLSPIFGKPLRAHPAPMQIGHIDAITYCLQLQPPLLDFSNYEELVRLLNEALALVDAEDQVLTGRSAQYKASTAGINLRIVCIKLLSASMMRSDSFPQTTAVATRTRIIGVFFKSLYSKAPEVVDVANKGLQQVLQQQHKLPKDLLQAGLRPILVNLSDHKKLTVAGLEGLARLLELLTNYFKVEIGRKLLDHLRQWAEPSVLQEAAGKPLIEIESIKIIVAILNVFHLLPPAAYVFLDDLVTIVLDLEEQLRRSMSSPFRLPLIKFLNRYSSNAIEYFYEKVGNDKFTRLFINLLGNDEATQLREDIMKNPSQLIDKTSNIQDLDNADEVKFQRIVIILEIVKFHPSWLVEPTSEPILQCIKEAWNDPGRLERLKREDTLSLSQCRESKYLVEIFIYYLKENPDDIDLLFELVTIFSYESVIDYTFLKKFYQEEVAMKYSVTQKRAILDKFLDSFMDPLIPANIKMQSLKVIITPMLLFAFNKGQEHEQIIGTVQMDRIQNIWRYLAETHDEIEDSLRIEVLQFSTLLVQRVPHLISVRSDLAKMGWNWSRADDITAKQTAFVFLAQIFAEFNSVNSKILFQSYFALLRAHQLEARTLVKQALDILVPVIPNLRTQHPLPSKESFDESKKDSKNKKAPTPTWIQYAKKVLLEDGHSVSQLVNVYQLLVRHPDLFYEHREHFMSQIANTLTRLGLLQSATAETRLLTIDLSELILKWEKRRISENRIPEQSSAVSTPAMTPDKRRIDSEPDNSPRKRMLIEHGGEYRSVIAEQNQKYTPNINLRESIVGYLTRFVCTSAESVSKTGLARRALELIKEFLLPDFWPEVNVKLSTFDRTLKYTEVNQSILNSVCNSLEVLNVILERKPADWCLANIVHLQQLLEHSIGSTQIKIQECLHPVLVHIYKSLAPPPFDEAITPLNPEQQPSSPDTEVENFIKIIHTTIQEALQNMNNLYTAMMLLKSVGCNTPKNIDPFLTGIIQVIQKLIKDLQQNASTSNSNSNGPQPPDSPISILIMALQLVNSRVSELTDQRPIFLSALSQLIEKTNNYELSRTIFEVVKEWVVSKLEPFPTLEEKSDLLVKMLCFESLDDKTLIEDFLNLVISIYSDPSFTRSDMTVKLEKAFLIGTRYNNPKIRNRFMEIFDRSMTRLLSTRLSYIISEQNWEFLANYFWLHQALDVLLGSVSFKKRIQPPTYSLQTKSITTFGECSNLSSFTPSNELEEFLVKHREFLRYLKKLRVSDLLPHLKQLHYLDDNLAYKLWVGLFPFCWATIPSKERQDLSNNLIALLSKDYHATQSELRPNCIQALLEGISRCLPTIRLPPHLVKFLGKSHGTWHTAMEILQTTFEGIKEDDKFKESTLDALADLYSTLSEDDMFYGLWKRRCKFPDTHTAISYEQCGNWTQALVAYENAQTKSRSMGSPCTESEYLLWEDHWVTCSQKLQQWDILIDFAKNENNIDLMFESAFRLIDLATEKEFFEQNVQAFMESHQNPRRKMFEAFMNLMKSQQSNNYDDFKKISEEAHQSALRKWHTLPNVVSQSHIPLLHSFQLLVEFDDATRMFSSLADISHQNADTKASELKSVLQSWRERLPNMWDDINVWSDIVAWRRHVFNVINKSFSQFQAQNTTNTMANTNYPFRGHHETAWTINRFAHVARKHQLSEVCINFLQLIYNLPNIEIQEAFLKLTEQTKCHYQNPSEVANALDVINNTNLNYFGSQQKAEFHTLRGMIQAKLGRDPEANDSFSRAVQVDMRLPKAWAAWGHYYDNKFKANPDETTFAANALSCYLQAAGLYNNPKSRKLLVRILWLLSVDDDKGHISRVFETYNSKSEVPALHFQLRTARDESMMIKRQQQAQQARAGQMSSSIINTSGAPQMSQSVSGSEGVNTNVIVNGNSHRPIQVSPEQSSPSQASSGQMSPQAINFSRSSPMPSQPPQSPAMQIGSNGNNVINGTINHMPSSLPNTPHNMQSMNGIHNGMSSSVPGTPLSGHAPTTPTNGIIHNTPITPTNVSQNPLPSTPTNNADGRSPITPGLGMNTNHHVLPNLAHTPQSQQASKQPWEHTEDVMSILKTSFPLLALSIETMVDQIQQQSRKRNLSFHLPLIIPLGPQIRIVQDDPSYCSLQEVYEDHCDVTGISKDEAIIYYTNKMRANMSHIQTAKDIGNLRVEIAEQIAAKFIPNELITWHFMVQRPVNEQNLRQKVALNVEQIVNKAQAIGGIDVEREK